MSGEMVGTHVMTRLAIVTDAKTIKATLDLANAGEETVFLNEEEVSANNNDPPVDVLCENAPAARDM